MLFAFEKRDMWEIPEWNFARYASDDPPDGLKAQGFLGHLLEQAMRMMR